MNPHKFLLCDNPNVPPEESQDFIYHSHAPRFLAKVEIVDQEMVFNQHSPIEPSHTFVYTDSEGIVELYSIEIIDRIDKADMPALEKALEQASKWYKEFLVREAGEGEEVLQDYNKYTKGLKIIRSASLDKWLVLYQGQREVFSDELLMDDYLAALGFNAQDLETGNVNEVG